MLCNISPNAMGQTRGVPCQVQLGGVPCKVQLGGYPARSSQGGTLPGGYPAGGYPAGGYPGMVPPSQVRMGVPCGGTLPGGTLQGGTQVWYPPSQVRTQGGYPVRTTKGVLTTRQAVCLLHSCRRTFLFLQYFTIFHNSRQTIFQPHFTQF